MTKDSSITTINKTVDLVHSPDDGGYYLQEYKNDGKGTTRNSPIYKDKNRVMALFNNDVIPWGKWE